jgi:osmotically-inducible protein OsmY
VKSIIFAALAALLLGACQRVEEDAPAFARASAPRPAVAAIEESHVDTPAPARPELVSDADLAATIGAKIRSDPALAGADVSVNASSGVVSLAGTVKSPEQLALASAHAQGEDGVMRVDSHLAVNLQ